MLRLVWLACIVVLGLESDIRTTGIELLTHAYDSHIIVGGTEGRWIQRNNTKMEEEFFEGYLRCPRPWRQNDCDDKRRKVFSWKWEEDRDSMLKKRKLKPLEHILDDRLDKLHLGFVGDSLSIQTFDSLRCSLGAFGAESRVYENNWDTGRCILRWPSKTAVKNNIHLKLSYGLSQFLVNWTGSKIHPKFNTTILSPFFLDLLETSAHDLTHLILNSGAWWYRWKEPNLANKFKTYREVIDSTFSLIHDFYAQRNRTMPKIIFRTTPHRHFMGKDWYQGGVCVYDGPLFGIPQRNWSGGAEVEGLNGELVTSIARWNAAMGGSTAQGAVGLWDVTGYADARADAHQRPEDCSHYCEPSTIYVWIQRLLQMVLEE